MQNGLKAYKYDSSNQNSYRGAAMNDGPANTKLSFTHSNQSLPSLPQKNILDASSNEKDMKRRLLNMTDKKR